MKMHEGEVDIDAELVERLLAAQLPRLLELPVRPVPSTGTVNAIYRLGDDLYVRMPRVRSWAKDLDKECNWLPKLAPRLTLQVPEPVAKGQPGCGYPFSWAVYRWIEGLPYRDELIDDERQAARDLARFVSELRGIDPSTGPPGGREPLHRLDAETREAINASSDVIDSGAANAAWERALEAPPWDGSPVWIHTDLLRPNLLVNGGQLRAVIDFGSVGVGDPAADIVAAWSVFGHTGRQTYRDVLAAHDATWNRARGFALHQAAMIIPYYAETNPGFMTLAKRTIEQIITDDRP